MEDGAVVVVDSGGGVLVQHAQRHQLLHALLGEIRIDGLGAVAQQSGEMMDVTGLSALQNHGDSGALLGADQILLQRGDGQQGGNGHVVLIHAPVGQDEDVGTLLIGPVHIDEQLIQGVCQGRALVVQQGDGLHMEAGAAHVPQLHQIHGGQNGVVDLQDRAVFRLLLEQVAAGASVHGGVGDNFLPDGVHGRVCHLGEELLEVVEQGLVMLAEHCQRGVHAHGGCRLGAVPGHGEDGVLDLLIGVAEGLVQPVPQFLGVGLHPLVGDGEVLQIDQMGVQPLAVGLLGGVAVLQLGVVHQAALPQVR